MNQITQNITDLYSTYIQPVMSTPAASVIVSILTIVIAVLTCLFGYRIIKIFIGIAGFVTGAAIGYIICTYLPVMWWVYIICAIVVGALVSFLFVKLNRFGTFFIIALSCSFIFRGILGMLLFNIADNILLIVSAVGGILIGIVGALLLRPFIIIVTAFNGAYAAVTTLLALMGFENQSMVLYISGGALTLIGIIYQFLTTKNE